MVLALLYSLFSIVFLPLDAMLAWYMLSSYVCVSVYVTRRYCVKMTKRTIMQTVPHDSPGVVCFWHQRL